MLVVGFIMCLVGGVLSKSSDPDKQASGRKVLMAGGIFVGIPVVVAIFVACSHVNCFTIKLKFFNLKIP
jgi:hypothetical protein